jgi:imidazolonepropionase-like amidohydrolase
MIRTNSLLVLLFTLLSLDISAQAQIKTKQPQPAREVIERGKFRFYETKEIRGEEDYTISRSKTGELFVQAKIALPFAGQDTKPKVIATLRTKADYTPRTFQINGPTLLEIHENTSVLVSGQTASIRDRGRNKTLKPSPVYFTLSGYVPVTMEMMLVRYWLSHGKPASLQLLPTGEAFVEFRGNDSVTISGKTIELRRYNLSGSGWRGGWGRQTLWFDRDDHLVAAVNLASDIETNFYVFRDGYESVPSFFLKRAVDDAIDRLTEIAQRMTSSTSSPIALVGATLIDVTGKPPVKDSVVVIQGDRIVSAGARSTTEIPSGATTIDVTGKFLLPGLWDMHAHLYQAELGPTYLAAGITTARDVGNDIEFATAFRDAALHGRGLGPRMLLAGYIDGKNKYHSFDVQVETPAEARAAVQRYQSAGYQQIKIRDDVKPETLKVICDEAHRLGMTVTGHVPKGMNALQAVEAGMDQIAHINFVLTGFYPDRDRNNPPLEIDFNAPNIKYALKFFKEHGTVIDPTMAVIELMLHPIKQPIASFEPGMSKVPPELLVQLNKKGQSGVPDELLAKVTDVMVNLVGGLHRAGVPVVAGTDVGVPGHTLHRELELYVKGGFTPLEAIQAATITPARVMKLENEVGTIEAGRRADLIIVDADPLQNISNIRKVKLVMTQGRLFNCAQLWQIMGFKP